MPANTEQFPWLADAAERMEQAAALIEGYCAVPSPEGLVRELTAEAEFLRSGDLAPIGHYPRSIADNLPGYVASSLGSRANSVKLWAEQAGIDPQSSALAAALDYLHQRI